MEIADLRQSLTRRYEGYDSETQTMDQVATTLLDPIVMLPA